MANTIMDAWADALESGKYEQGTNKLVNVEKDGSKTFCCLGVLCDIAEQAGIVKSELRDNHKDEPDEGFHVQYLAYAGETGYLPADVGRWAGLRKDGPNGFAESASWDNPMMHVPAYIRENREKELALKLPDRISATSMNDSYGFTFEQIAACIRATEF